MRQLAALLILVTLSACASPAPTVAPASTQPPAPSVSPSPSPPPSQPLQTSPSPPPSPTASPSPSASVSCVPEPAEVAPGGSGDPCPSALAAVEAVVAPLGLPVSQIRIQPGPFQCGVLWPGVQSPVVCFGPVIVPGASMHGWVAFEGTAKIAAVGLSRTPPNGSVPAGPWKAAVVAFAVPPDGWAMP
jgi:hypothetical protein